MGSLNHRLARVEERMRASAGEAGDRREWEVSRRVLGRLSDGELEAYEAAAGRREAGGEPAPEDEAIARRVRRLHEEAGRGLAQEA